MEVVRRLLTRFGVHLPWWLLEAVVLGVAVGSFFKCQYFRAALQIPATLSVDALPKAGMLADDKLRSRLVKNPLVAAALRVALKSERAKRNSYAFALCLILLATAIGWWRLRKKIIVSASDTPVAIIRHTAVSVRRSADSIEQLSSAVAERSANVVEELQQTWKELQVVEQALTEVANEHKAVREKLIAIGIDPDIESGPGPTRSAISDTDDCRDAESEIKCIDTEVESSFVSYSSVEESEAEMQPSSVHMPKSSYETSPSDEAQRSPASSAQPLPTVAVTHSEAQYQDATVTTSPHRQDAAAWDGNNIDFLTFDPENYHSRLQANVACTTELFRAANMLSSSIECEVHPSAKHHYRQRVGFGIFCPEAANEWRQPCPGGDGLSCRYVYAHEGKLMPVADNRFPVACKAIYNIMAEVLQHCGNDHQLRCGLRAAKYKASTGGDVLLTLIYGGNSGQKQTLGPEWAAAADRLRCETPGLVGVIGRAKGSRVVSGSDHLVEEGFILADGRSPRYVHTETAFSNPNAGMAVHTLNWLSSCADQIRQEIQQHTGKDNEPLDLLELFCGNGNHTVVMAGVFDAVLAVEIAPELVAAAEQNFKLNSISNATVLCVNARYFSRNMLGSRSFDLKPAGASNAGRSFNFQAVLVDPPRAGLDDYTRTKIIRYPHIFYISCNPRALRRDLSTLLQTHEIARFAFFDHFPYTKHTECGVLLHFRPPGAPRPVMSWTPQDEAADKSPRNDASYIKGTTSLLTPSLLPILTTKRALDRTHIEQDLFIGDGVVLGPCTKSCGGSALAGHWLVKLTKAGESAKLWNAVAETETTVTISVHHELLRPKRRGMDISQLKI